MRRGRTLKGQTSQRSGKRAAVEAANERALRLAEAKARARRLKGQVLVNVANLRPTNSYDIPDFVRREFYVDRPFTCKDCGVSEIWTATQQKWWYETAKGDVWTAAVRCRLCRRRERERKAMARQAYEKGIAKKRSGP